MNWYLEVIRNYFDFEGPARRKEYWMFTLFHFVFIFVAIVLDAVMGVGQFGEGFIYLIYFLLTLIPSIAVRRMHDIGKSGFIVLVNFIPLIGGIWFLVLAVTEGDHGENQYGSDPKDAIY